MPQVMPLARASKPPKGAKVQQPPAAARSARQASRSARQAARARQAAPSALVLPAHRKAASLKANNCPIRDAGRGR